MKLIIDIDVLNPEEVMRSHRGEIVGLMAGIVMSHEKKKYKVEKAICDEMINILKVEYIRCSLIIINIKLTT